MEMEIPWKRNSGLQQAASSGSLTFTLRHEPKKPNTGLGDAG